MANFLPRFLSTLVAGILLATVLPAQGQAWQWARAGYMNAGSRQADISATATAIGASGDIYSAYWGGAGFPKSFLVHYSPAGAVLDTLLTSANAKICDLQIDSVGSLYATGLFSGTLTASSTTLTALSINNTFLVKWNPTGGVEWTKQTSSFTSQSYAGNLPRVAVDGPGNVTLMTTFEGRFDFDTLHIQSLDSVSTLFLAQFSPVGTLRWLKTSRQGAVPYLTVGGLAAAPDGSLFLVARAFGDFTLGTDVVNCPTATDYFVWLKLDGNGHLVNQKIFSVFLGSDYFNVAADHSGNSYVVANGRGFVWGGSPASGGFSGRVFFTKLNAVGNPEWLNSARADSALSFGLEGTKLCITPRLANPQLFIGGSHNGRMSCGSLSLANFDPANFNNSQFLLAVGTATGSPNWLLEGAKSRYVNLGALNCNRTGQLSVGGGTYGDTTAFGNLALVDTSTTSCPFCSIGFTAKLTQDFNLIQGGIFTDTNSNGTQDAGEADRSGVIVQALPGPYFAASDRTGQYAAVVDLGTYSLSVPQPPLYYTVAPTGPATATFSTYGNVATGHRFALQPTANQQDLEAILTPISRARPGFPMLYRVTARNVGTVPMTGTSLRFVFDPLLTYVRSSLPATVIGHAFNCSLGTLQPNDTREMTVEFLLAASAPLGHILPASVNLLPITGDLTPPDNVGEATLRVTGSYDPNDITVNPTFLTEAQVQGDMPIDYTIRFQNTGTDTAFSVIIRDTLPADMLRISSLRVLSASHNLTWSVDGNHVFTARFSGINLPDSTTNRAASMGFVRFQILGSYTLVAGDVIPNQAAVYFDFNAPVITNTATTTISRPTGTSSETATLSGGAWPNPVTGTLHVALDLPSATPLTVTLTDGLGRAVQTKTSAAAAGHFQTALDVSGFAPGLYMLRAQAAGRGFSQRIVVR